MAQNIDKDELVRLTASGTSGATFAHDNAFWLGMQLGVNITALAGTSPTLTVIIEGQDGASKVWYPVMTSAALNSIGFTLLTLYPGVTAVANIAASQILPKTWRVRYVIGGTAPQVTATIGSSMVD